MSFWRYLGDKRYFVLLYAASLLFVSLNILLSAENTAAALGTIAYTNAGCGFLAAAYITAGYFYRRPYYRKLEDLRSRLEASASAPLTVWPEAQTAEQALSLELLDRLQRGHAARLDLLLREKREHQDFIMSWIHEVKLPIAASRLVMTRSEDKTVDYVVDKLEDELDRIDHYVEQALNYSRIDTFSRDYLITELELAPIVRESVKKAAKLFITKRIRLRLEEGSIRAYSDAKWLGYIVDQLVSNGVKYTPEGGELAISFEEDDRERRLIFRDTGIGIRPEELHRVFDKGFTGSNGRTHAKSTGMGLYLAKQLALKLGHDLTIASEEGVYTRASIHFPKIRPLLTSAEG